MTAADRETWLTLLTEAARLSNAKVRDLGPLKRAGRAAAKVPFPDGYAAPGNPFSRLIRLVEALQPDQDNARATIIVEGEACAAILDRAAPAPGDFGQQTHIHDRRKDIYG